MIESCSSIQCGLDCKKKYDYKYIQRLEQATYNNNLGLGTLVHAYAEGEDALNRDTEDLVTRFPESNDSIMVDRYKAQAMYDAQAFHFDQKDKEEPEANEHLTDWKREVEWSMPVHRDIRLVGKSDGTVVHTGRNEVCLYELKTSGMMYQKEKYIKLLDNNLQIDINMIAHGVTTCIYDIIWKPGIRQRKNATAKLPAETDMEFAQRWVEQFNTEPAKHFTRLFITRTPEQLTRSLNEAIDTVVAINTTPAYRNRGNCDKFNSLCEFFDVCVDDLEPAGFKVRDKKFPELTKEIQIEQENNS